MPDTNNMLLSEADLRKIFMAANESVFRGTGQGSFYGQYQANLRGIDRFGYNVLPINTELKGLTFITRPRLNLSTSSLRQDRVLSTLDTTNPNSLPFMIRSLLDTNLQKNGSKLSDICKNSVFIDTRNPFITPLMNCIIGINGWPDPVLDVETTGAGFHSEDVTFVKGHDMLNKSYDLNLTVRDVQGGIIMSILYMWIRWMGLVAKGIVVPYPTDIYERRLCYTCSIYRFLLDPSTRVITKWAKATGCFPKSPPLGSVFNLNENEQFVSSAMTFSIPFQINKVDYMDPIVFNEFNRLIRRYCTDLKNMPDGDSGSLIPVDPNPENNFKGIPYIDTESGTNELMFFEKASELQDPLEKVMDEMSTKLASAKKTLLDEAYAGEGNYEEITRYV